MRKVCLEIWLHSTKAAYICVKTGLGHSYKENRKWQWPISKASAFKHFIVPPSKQQ